MSIARQIRAEVAEASGLMVRTWKYTLIACLVMMPIGSAAMHIRQGSPIADVVLGILISAILGVLFGALVGVLTSVVAVLCRVAGFGSLILLAGIVIFGWAAVWLCAPWIDPAAPTRTEGATNGLVSLLLSPLILAHPKGIGKALVPILITAVAMLVGAVVGAVAASPLALLILVRRFRLRARARQFEESSP